MKYYAIFIGQILTLACASGQTSKQEPSASVHGMDAGADAAAPATPADASTSAGGAAMESDDGPEEPDATDGTSTDGGSTGGNSTDGGSTGGSSTDSGSTGGSGSDPDPVTALALDGPVTLAPGGVAVLALNPGALMSLSSLSLGGLEIPLDDGERVQFVLVRPENAGEIDVSALDGLKLTVDSLGAVPEEFHDWLRVTVRVPTDVPAGEAEFELLTSEDDRFVWPVQMIGDVGPYVPPSPDGIIWPAVRSSGGVFPVGTQGPYHALTDPLFEPSYPRPMNPADVAYDLRLSEPGHFFCPSAAPLQGEIMGAERIKFVDEDGTPAQVYNPIFGTYDWERNFVELTINRSAMGGGPELYRGGWVEGDYHSIPEPSARGQLARPTSGSTLIALHAVRTGLPLTITHVSKTDAFEEACSMPRPYADKHLQIQNLWRSDLFINAQGEKLAASAVTDDSATWQLEPAQDGYDPHYRIRNELSGAYLHYQGGEFQLGPIDPGWQSAQWEIDDFGEYVEIRNRLHPDKELNVEFGTLESSALPDDYWSTRWVLSEVSSVSQPREAQKASIPSECTPNGEKLSVMSYNLRSLNDGDTGPQAWENRRACLAQQILDHAPDLLGVQEATPEQMADLADALPDYHRSGLGRLGGLEGEFSAVFYEKTRFTLLAEDTFWLAQNPEARASIGWQESLGLPRVVSWVKVFDKLTCKTMLHFNTQVGFGQEAQMNSALLLRERAAQISGNAPYVITGDFNFGSTTDPFGALVVPGRGALADTYPTDGTHQGPLGTLFTEMNRVYVQTPRIDFIFQVPGQFEVLTHAHLESVVDWRYPSDHVPVLVEFAPKP